MKKQCKHRWKKIKRAGSYRQKCSKCDMVRARPHEHEWALLSLDDCPQGPVEECRVCNQRRDAPAEKLPPKIEYKNHDCHACGQNHINMNGDPIDCIRALVKRVSDLEDGLRRTNLRTGPIVTRFTVLGSKR